MYSQSRKYAQEMASASVWSHFKPTKAHRRLVYATNLVRSSQSFFLSFFFFLKQIENKIIILYPLS
jgi:hypothetical protein